MGKALRSRASDVRLPITYFRLLCGEQIFILSAEFLQASVKICGALFKVLALAAFLFELGMSARAFRVVFVEISLNASQFVDGLLMILEMLLELVFHLAQRSQFLFEEPEPFFFFAQDIFGFLQRGFAGVCLIAQVGFDA